MEAAFQVYCVDVALLNYIYLYIPVIGIGIGIAHSTGSYFLYVLLSPPRSFFGVLRTYGSSADCAQVDFNLLRANQGRGLLKALFEVAHRHLSRNWFALVCSRNFTQLTRQTLHISLLSLDTACQREMTVI